MHTTVTIRHLTPDSSVVEWKLANGRKGTRLFSSTDGSHRITVSGFADGMICGFAESVTALGTICSAVTVEGSEP